MIRCRVCLVIAAAALVSCSGGDGGGGTVSEQEPNDSVDQATPLGGPGTRRFEGECTASQFDDGDTFKLSTSGGGTVSVSLEWSDWGDADGSITLILGDASEVVPAGADGDDWGIESPATDETMYLEIRCNGLSVNYSGTARIP